MPEVLQVIVLLAVGYILLLLEVFVPGGVLGILGGVAILYGCYLAFGMSTAWGMTAVAGSVVVALVSVRLFLRSRMGKGLVLEERESEGWKAPDERLAELVGQAGRTLTPLRPTGLAEIDDRRIDVVADSEFIGVGVAVRVSEVEGRRVVVEPTESSESSVGDQPAKSC
ncbi:MAG: hypothetical protein GY856_00295 [bacterium]|nr:hypothetical protein [bacterium]